MRKIIAVALGLALAVPAGAQTVTAKDPQSVARALQAAGYKAEMNKGSDGQTYITSSSGGSKFSVFFNDCDNGAACKTLQFYAGWTNKVTPEQMNVWNRDHRFGRAYADDKSEPNVEYDVDLEGGPVSDAVFRSNIETWASVMGAFERYIADTTK